MIRTYALWLTLMLTTAAPLLSGSAWSQESPPPGAVEAPASPINWSSLPEQQQKLLENFHSQWDSLPPARQQVLSAGAARWAQMSPQQRDGARGRFQNWQHLPPQQQLLIRQRWQRFQQLTPEQQSAVRQNYHAFSGLPPEQRERLRERWINASPQQRMQMLQSQRARRMQRNGPAPGFHRSPTPEERR